jgi:hypothetical protein
MYFNKKSNDKKIVMYKNTFILKLHLNAVTAGIPVSKMFATCELSHVLTPSINSSLLLSCDPNQFFR